MSSKDNRLPTNATLVFKGKLFEVWQWEQKMYDGSAETFERIRRADTVQVIAVAGDKILIQQQEQPDRPESFISLPGGRCDNNEDPLTAIKRELLEETGYASKDWALWKEHHPAGKILWDGYTYIARNALYQEAPHLDAGEKIEVKLISFDEFLALADNPAFRGRELLLEPLVRARYDEKARDELHVALFGHGA